MKTVSVSKKQVRETAAGKSISAYIILNQKGEHVATVQAAYLNSGTVMVDVWDKHSLIYQGKAGGGGYDKFTAALAGAKIDGYTIYNHSEGVWVDASERIFEKYPELTNIMRQYLTIGSTNDVIIKAELQAAGAEFANLKSTEKGCFYQSLYYKAGLERLTAIGYKVIKVI
jgi:hypothetical protein